MWSGRGKEEREMRGRRGERSKRGKEDEWKKRGEEKEEGRGVRD